MKRSRSSHFQFRRRIPSDILDRLRGQTLRIPVGDRVVEKQLSAKAMEVGFSLGTRDPAEAKAREALAIAHLDRVFDSYRNGPKRLTKREAVALAGEVYRDWLEIAGDDPGPAELWDEIVTVNETAMEGGFGMAALMIGDKAKTRYAMEQRFGPFADGVLQRHALTVDDASRALVIEETAKAMVQASGQLKRHADGDFRPDPDGDRFPTMPSPGPKAPGKAPEASLPFDTLIDKRWREAEAGGGSLRTLSAWRSTFKHLRTFLKHDDATRVTKADIVAFKDHRIEQGVSLKTVRDSDLALLKSNFGWAVSNGYLETNPAEGVTVKLGRSATKDRQRTKGFTDDEAVAILREAKTRTAPERELVKTTAARRWIHWLCAFSGARVGEIAQLRKEDIVLQDGRWLMRITPEAGAVKTGVSRRVPLHLQLVEDGFIDFVKDAPDGYLFMTPKDPKNPFGALRGLTNRLRRTKDNSSGDDGVQPFHAWRHRFMTQAREMGLDDSLVRAIVGHASKDVHDTYGDYTIKAMARLIDSLPRFDV